MFLLITFLSGISTLIGYLFIFIKDNNNKLIISSLAFASGVMICLSIFSLIPESFTILNYKYNIIYSYLICLLFIILGIFITSIFNKYFSYESKLYKIGIISMLAITIHNIPEGIITYLTANYNIKMGIFLAVAIALHNIPEGISISIPIYYSSNSKYKAFIYTFIAGISELFGAIICCIFFSNGISSSIISYLSLCVAGIMIYISCYELLPLSFRYNNYSLTLLYFFLGIFIMFISISLIQ